jgi:hypothetical protein
VLLAEPKRWSRRCGRADDVDVAKSALEVATNERASFLSLQVIGVVISRRKHERSEQDSPLYLSSETSVAGRAVHPPKVALSRGAERAQAVANAIETSEIARRLGGRKDVVRADGKSRVRQAHGTHDASGGRKSGKRCTNALFDLGVEAFGKVFVRDADAHASDAFAASAFVVAHGDVE